MDALEALAQFKQGGGAKQATSFKKTPALKFSKTGGQFVIGTFNEYRALPEDSKAGKGVIDLVLKTTNAAFTTRIDDEYKEVPVKEGDTVAVFAPTALDRLMKDIPVGSELYIRCEGRIKEVRNGKTSDFYKFDVRWK